jgi:hypothetical protein
MNDALAAARDNIERGWAPVPVPFRTKGPLLEEWQNTRINAETAPNLFNSGPQNIGIILGSASGRLARPRAARALRISAGIARPANARCLVDRLERHAWFPPEGHENDRGMRDPTTYSHLDVPQGSVESGPALGARHMSAEAAA